MLGSRGMDEMMLDVFTGLGNSQASTNHITEADWSKQSDRDAYFKSNPENFADRDNQNYPIKDADDVKSAAGLYGKSDNPDAVKSNIKSIAKRLGLSSALPSEWTEDLYTDQDASGGGLPDVYGPDQGQGVYGGNS